MPNTFPKPSESNVTSMASLGHTHPGKVTKGPGNNKPRIHLVSSKGKIPAGVYAEAIALKQKNQAAQAAKMPAHHHAKKTNPNVGVAHTTLPTGVKGYDVTPKTGLT